jgi:hypothetical protein
MSQPLSEQTGQRLLQEFMKMQADVVLIKAKSDDTHARLFGNHQPGELKLIKDQLEEHSDWITRADEREKTNRKWTAAITAGCGTLAGALAGWLARLLR